MEDTNRPQREARLFSSHKQWGPPHATFPAPPPFCRWQYSDDKSPNSSFYFIPLEQRLFKQVVLFNLHFQSFCVAVPYELRVYIKATLPLSLPF